MKGMEPLLRQLKTVSTVRVARKGSNIIFQGEVPRRAMVIRDGIVRSYMITSAGEERTVALHGKGELLPLSWVFDKTPTSLFYYEALNDARLLSFTKEDLIQTLQTHPRLYKDLLEQTVSLHSGLLLRIAGLEQSRAIEKIGFTLYYLLFRFGIEGKDSIYKVEINLSQRMIASLVGLTRESTTKTLKIFKDKGIISHASSMYSINKKKLESYLGEDSFRDLTL